MTVSFEIAKLLNEAEIGCSDFCIWCDKFYFTGWNKGTLIDYNGIGKRKAIPAPKVSDLFDFLRSKGIYIESCIVGTLNNLPAFRYKILFVKNVFNDSGIFVKSVINTFSAKSLCKNYDECIEKSLIHTFEILKQIKENEEV
jgi:hypothetical protein